MKNNDKLFEQYKALAQDNEEKTFPSFEKVWNKVEDKLDKKVLKKQNSLWKKIAIAASILLFASVSYHYWQQDKKHIKPTNEITVEKSIINVTEEKVATITKPEETLVKNPEKVLEKQLNNDQPIALTEDKTADFEPQKQAEPINKAYSLPKIADEGNWLVSRNRDARGVVYEDAVQTLPDASATNSKEQEPKKESPIVIVDGKLQKNADLENEDVETITHLPNPLYIINGVYYTEQEVFGPNPTSPYSPLKKQKIETITVLEPEKAQKIYGEKGKNGIVIITTKNGKPAERKN